MANLADLVVSITAQTKQFDTAIKETRTKVKDTETGIKKTTTAIKGLVTGVAVASLVAKIGQIAGASIEAAGEAEEAQAKFETAFDGIETKAGETAEELARVYGLSQTESKKLLGDTGDLLKGFGATATGALEFSKEIQELSVDLASYNNVQGGASRVSKILTKSVMGNKDGLTELGVSLLDVDIKQELVRTGQDKLTGQAGKLAKAQATFNLILQQTGDAQGDYIRTSDSYTNTSRQAEAATKDLQAELGRALLPTATSVKSVFGELTVKMTEYLKGLNDLKALEQARALGLETRANELSFAELNLTVLQRKLEVQKKANDVDLRQHKVITPLNKRATELLERSITSTALKIDEINKEIKAEKTLADAQIEKSKKEEEASRKREEEAKITQLNYDNTLTAINDVIDANKSQIETIDDEIVAIESLEAKDEETRAKQLEAVQLLQAEKQVLLDEEEEAKKQALLNELNAQREFDEETRKIRQEAQNDKDNKRKEELEKEKALQQELTSLAFGAADSISQIGSNLNQEKVNRIEAETQATIDGLDEELLGTEEYEKQVQQLKEDTANRVYAIELEQFRAEKALSAIQAGVNTALALTNPLVLINPFLAAATAAAGALQVGAILSQPDPPRPQFAQGGTVVGATNIIAGEDRGEIMFGMGGKGQPFRAEFAKELATEVNKGGRDIVINLNGNGVFSNRDLENFARKIRPALVNEDKRLGIGV